MRTTVLARFEDELAGWDIPAVYGEEPPRAPGDEDTGRTLLDTGHQPGDRADERAMESLVALARDA